MTTNLWFKLANDGDKGVVVFLGDPFPREVCFSEGEGKYIAFDEKARAQGLKRSLRVAINVAMVKTREVKVLEVGTVFFKDLVRAREKYGLENWAFEVCRHGAAKDRKTTYSILPEQQLTPELKKVFGALPLHDLAKVYRRCDAYHAMIEHSGARFDLCFHDILASDCAQCRPKTEPETRE